MRLRTPSRLALAGAWLLALANVPVLPAEPKGESAATAKPVVRIVTGLGAIELELAREQAPITVANFLRYVDEGFYVGTIFHRVIRGFMIQGGGLRPDMERKPTRAAIKNEADNGLRNLAGTIAMARTADPHSANSQFFINTVDNPSLDHQEKSRAGWGYAVFGRVTRGMDVVRRIESLPTRQVRLFGNVPQEAVLIKDVQVLRR